MGQVKKAFMDWCEKHDKNPNEDEMQAMCDLEELQWHMDFEDWLQANNRHPSGEDNHG